MSNENLSALWNEGLQFVSRYYNPDVRVYWLFLLSSVLLAGISYRKYQAPHNQLSLAGFARFLFPKSVWLGKSAIVDYKYFILTVPLLSAVVSPALLSSSTVAAQVADLFARTTDLSVNAYNPVAVGIFYTVVLFLADDFRRFIVHYTFHRFPVLWEFHKVHHSAEVMTPITLYRDHPVYSVVAGVTSAVLRGLVTGLFIAIFGDSLSIMTAIGINVGHFVFNVLGTNLRHSHIWLSWGPRWEKIFISPAQHQIHHSSERRHFDKNFGSALAIWDRMFGTLYIPKGRENIVFGLPDEPDRWFDSAFGLIARPFRDAYSVLVGQSANEKIL